jgi:hypothetical protein
MEYKEICLDIQRFHKHTTRVSTTHDQILKELWHNKILDISFPLAHQTRYKLNLNYVAIVKHDIDKLLTVWFI